MPGGRAFLACGCISSTSATSALFDHGGADVNRLSDEQFAVWGLAHGAPDRDSAKRWGRQAVINAAGRVGVSKPDEVLESLVADHLVEVTPETDAAR